VLTQEQWLGHAGVVVGVLAALSFLLQNGINPKPCLVQEGVSWWRVPGAWGLLGADPGHVQATCCLRVSLPEMHTYVTCMFGSRQCWIGLCCCWACQVESVGRCGQGDIVAGISAIATLVSCVQRCSGLKAPVGEVPTLSNI
jgi:hypothetical protein